LKIERKENQGEKKRKQQKKKDNTTDTIKK
jgi:hypothetical protein